MIPSDDRGFTLGDGLFETVLARAGELVALEWAHIDFRTGLLVVRRAKHGLDSTQPLTGRELRA